MTDIRTDTDILDQWTAEKGKVEKFKTSDDALKVLVWRYNHMRSYDFNRCSLETGIPVEKVRDWWSGIDFVFQASGGCHFHYPRNMTLSEWREEINELLTNNG